MCLMGIKIKYKNNMKEIWYDIKAFEGYYQYSNCFRFRTVERIIIKSNGVQKTIRKQILKIQSNGEYPVLNLSKLINNKREGKTIFIHKFFAEIYIPNIENKPHVNHINGNKLDYSLSNLEWCTKSEDVQHAHDTGLMPSLKGTKRMERVLSSIVKNSKIHGAARLVIDTETGIFYNSIKEAAQAKNYKQNTLSHKLNSRILNNTSYVFA